MYAFSTKNQIANVGVAFRQSVGKIRIFKIHFVGFLQFVDAQNILVQMIGEVRFL
jgi:hypothetical protein